MQKLTVAVTWIAIKIEEQTKLAWLTDVAMVFHVLQQREESDRASLPSPDSEEFVKLKAEICSTYEMGVFDALGFICHVDHPHKLTSNIPGLIFYDKEMKRDEIPEGLLQVCSSNFVLAEQHGVWLLVSLRLSVNKCVTCVDVCRRRGALQTTLCKYPYAYASAR